MAINQAGIGLLIALALLCAPFTSYAQQPADETKKAEGKADEADADDDEGDDDDDDTDGADKKGDDDDEGPVGLEALCELDPDNCVKINMEEYAARDIQAEMYAVQQIYALRARRVEVNLYAGLTMNDQFVSHNAPGLALTYYITNTIGVGVNGNFNFGMNSESDFNFETTRAARIGMPITEYQFNVNAQVYYVPAYGKFSGFQDFIFHYDIYALAGGGIISTRPIAVVDPDNRSFDYKIKPTWGLGAGIRIFFNRWLAAMLEIRDYMFFDELEDPRAYSGLCTAQDGCERGIDTPLAQDPTTYYSDDLSFTNNVQAQVGISVFLPPTWKYKLPK